MYAIGGALPNPKGGGFPSPVTIAFDVLASTVEPGGAAQPGLGPRGFGCQSTDAARTFPTALARPPRAGMIIRRSSGATKAIERPSGEKAGALPRARRRTRPPRAPMITTQSACTTAIASPVGDHDGSLPATSLISFPGRPAQTAPPRTTATFPPADHTASVAVPRRG